MNQRRAAFTLVELSIVLVILGLLVGGVLTGQSLIRAAELRSITSDYTRYITATRAFRDKYFYLPGDMPNATSFWGKDPSVSAASCNSGSDPDAATGNGTCNGTADGNINATAVGTSEAYQYWRQLALAGLIEGNYTGLSVTNKWNAQVGSNVPRSKLGPQIGWFTYYLGSYAGDTTVYTADYGNMFEFGLQATNARVTGSALNPTDAWNIDTKMDDGKPGTGTVMARNWSTCGTATSSTDYAAPYNFANTAVVCGLLFPKHS